MSSILTNARSIVALQTLKSINMGLSKTQSEISTGKSVASAKDNAAVWAISKVMEADVRGYNTISDSLSLGQSSVAVASQASGTVSTLLTDIKTKIVAAQSSNVDRAKLQSDIKSLRKQITSVVNAAQFNGLNLLNGSVTATNTNSNAGVNIMSSLDRASDGTVSSSSIGVDAKNLSLTAGTALTALAANVGVDAGTANVIDKNDGGTNDSITLDTFAFLTSAGAATGTVALGNTAAGVVTTNAAGLVNGDQLSLTIGSVTARYTVKTGDTATSAVSGVKNALISAGLDMTKFTLDASTATNQLKITNKTNADIAYSFKATRGTGKLADLSSIDVSTAAGATSALGKIETLIQSAIDATASFGAVQNRIKIQSTFMSKLTDSIKTGIGALVDANMEEASARLQALQVQQQLGVQSLSIANKAPQSLLSLFR